MSRPCSRASSRWDLADGSHKFPQFLQNTSHVVSPNSWAGHQQGQLRTTYTHRPASPALQCAQEILLRPIRHATVLLCTALPSVCPVVYRTVVLDTTSPTLSALEGSNNCRRKDVYLQQEDGGHAVGQINKNHLTKEHSGPDVKEVVPNPKSLPTIESPIEIY